MTKKIKKTFLFTLLLIVCGCALPDLKPFANSTAELHGAIVKTDSNVKKLLVEAGATSGANSISAEIQVRIHAMQAVVKYTDALANIAGAGEKGSENASKIANSLDQFLNIFSVGPLPISYVGVAKGLYGIVANVRAAKSFSEAVSKADPAIQSMSSVLISDFILLDSVVAQTTQQIITNISAIPENNQVIDHRQKLEKRRRTLETSISNNPPATAKVKELMVVNSLIDVTRDRYEPLMISMKSTEDKVVIYRDLIGKTREGIKQWADIHANLANAVNTGLPPNTRLLSATVIALRNILSEESKK